MANNFGLKIGVEGEREFKKALNEINGQMKVIVSKLTGPFTRYKSELFTDR